MSDPHLSNPQRAVVEAAVAWLKRFETSGLVVADLDVEAQKLVEVTRALRDLESDDGG